MTNNKELFGIAATFDNPDKLVNAAKTIEGSGFKKYDVHTPYPIHGLDKAMNLRPSILSYIALVIGLSGALGIVLFILWSVTIDYPLVIGGKHHFASPGYLPITFEVTVLTAAVGTAITMLFIFFKMPNNSHPLHDTLYMKNVSSDKYGIVIESTDKNFDEARVDSLFEQLGALEKIPIYYDFDEHFTQRKIFNSKFVTFLVAVALGTAGLTYLTLNLVFDITPYDWMKHQFKAMPQGDNSYFKDGFSMRTPPMGTVSRDYMPYQFHNQPDSAGMMLINPIIPDTSNLSKGRNLFLTYCSPCHDNLATGHNRLNGQFPNPPTLHSDKVRGWSDGRIYHVITEGQNIMPSYAKQIIPEDRWRIILYIRALQRALNANEGDVQQ